MPNPDRIDPATPGRNHLGGQTLCARRFPGQPREMRTPGDTKQGAAFSLGAAGTRAARGKAYRLAWEVYRERGYVDVRSRRMIVEPYDAAPETLTLLAESQGTACGTVSLVFDGPRGLPCDPLHAIEIDEIRQSNKRVAEVTRLAVRAEYPRSTALVVRMFNWIYLYARRVEAVDEFVIEVNPRHRRFYGRVLGFRSCGPERPCPRVRGAPAALMRLDLKRVERTVEALRNYEKGPQGKMEAGLYRKAVPPDEEAAIVRTLLRTHRPISEPDARFFGLTLPEAGRGGSPGIRSAALETQPSDPTRTR